MRLDAMTSVRGRCGAARLIALVVLAVAWGGGLREGRCAEINVKITGATVGRDVGLVRTIVQVPKEFEKTRGFLLRRGSETKAEENGRIAIGQLAELSGEADVPEPAEGMVTRELLVYPIGTANDSTLYYHVTLGALDILRLGGNGAPSDEEKKKWIEKFENRFEWHDTAGKSLELRCEKRPVLRYMYEAVDNSSKERRGETYKVYHHVFDPEGERLLTKGPGGLFPHHRGLFYGFNKISYGDKQQADVWHCNNGEWQEHVKVISQETGPVMGRHRLAIDWHGRDGKVFAKEERQISAAMLHKTEGLVEGDDHSTGTMIDFTSKLTSTVGPLKLDGDPQHAGFQFRASQEVPDKTAKETYYLRPDGKGEPGKFRNWPQDKGHENLAWNALSFVIEGQRYTVVYLDHPKNPKPARYSERDYGRFGSYFVAELDEGKPLTVQYRVWVQRGEMTVEQCEALSKAFVAPVKVEAEVK